MQALAGGLEFDGGRFVLRRRLGGGAGGEVWLATQAASDAPVALKFLDPEVAARPDAVTLFADECRKARSLVHPNIVRVHDCIEADGRHVLVMQAIDGAPLTVLRGAPFPDIVRAAVMLCDALDCAHRAGVVHRDLKPANVLRDTRGVCYLGDFGTAALLDGAGLALRGGGSLPYMSPQQLAGAPAAVSDDVYGLGALLYDLLTGRPPFDPGATAERVRDEVLPRLAADGTGRPLPPALASLVAAMLDKSPTRRPPGMLAVRAVLDELVADTAPVHADGDGPIRPVRRAGRAGPAPAAGGAAPGAAVARPRRGLPAGLVVGGLAVLLAAALGVVVILPELVAERGAAVDLAPARPPTVREAPPPAADPARRAAADAALADFVGLEDALRARAVERWGGADWTEARRLADAADASYRDRDFGAAADAYRDATGRLRALEPRWPAVRDQALAEGRAALAAGDGPGAETAFGLALAVDPESEAARAGLARVARLDELLGWVAEAARAEAAGDLDAAIRAYRAALEVDSDWAAAREGLARVRGARTRGVYETRMAEGYAALAAENFDAARRAFRAALDAAPGNADARAALAQVDADARLARIIALSAEARGLEAREDWPAAAERYRAIVELDASVASAREGLARAEARAAIVAGLDAAIAGRDRLNDDRRFAAARETLARARAIDSPGPQLAGRIETLARALEIASRPVQVQFRSDSLTEVTIYKVGRLGSFDSTTIALKPGTYVAVGSRDGYRDVRRDFLVRPDGATGPVEIRCEEPI